MGKKKSTAPIDRNKFLFVFHDGERERRVDAWKVFLAIQADVPAELHLSGGADSAANSRLLDSFRKAIGVTAWSEETQSGMTDGEALMLLLEFVEFVGAEKKSTKREPTSPPSTELKHYD